jgi:hypothetical protein
MKHPFAAYNLFLSDWTPLEKSIKGRKHGKIRVISINKS